MKKNSRALDVAQEFMPEAFAFRRSFDKSGNIREDKAAAQSAEIGLKRGELVAAHFCVGIGQRI